MIQNRTPERREVRIEVIRDELWQWNEYHDPADSWQSVDLWCGDPERQGYGESRSWDGGEGRRNPRRRSAVSFESASSQSVIPGVAGDRPLDRKTMPSIRQRHRLP